MKAQAVFKRYEFKYLLTMVQYEELLKYMDGYMELDEYGRHKISNIYFDTDDYRIIRNSIEKPKYKEKLRLRIYGEAKQGGKAFIELKKKCKGIVYKRRITAPQTHKLLSLCDNIDILEESQIQREIKYFVERFDTLGPKVYLSYDREAYHSLKKDDFRLTLDFNIKIRDWDVSLMESEKDNKIISDNQVLMEVKTVQGLPFWFLSFLKNNNVNKTSFSKYGKGFEKYILPSLTQKYRRVSNG